MCRSWDMAPTAAPDGRSALLALETSLRDGRRFELILMDGLMPEMDGFAVAEEIQRRPEIAGATIMMLTSSGRLRETARCRELGISAYLTKPVSQSDLLDRILLALRSAKRVERAAPAPRAFRGETGGRLEILLAEDNPVNQMFARRLLEKWGHSVTLAPNGAEAVRAWEEGEFDVVLMDVQMPEMN